MQHILIVEDEVLFRSTLAGILSDAGYRISEAGDGREALEKLTGENAESVDLLLLDIAMPGMNGVDMMEELNRRSYKVPVLVMTGFGNKELLIRIIRVGCTDYIDKPFSPERLLEMIREILKKGEMQREQRENAIAAVRSEKAQMQRAIEAYRTKYRDIKNEVDRAAREFNSLVNVNTEGLRAPFAYKIKPYSTLGGDFLGVHNSPNGIDMLIADVAGHDLSASYHTVVVKSLFEDNVRAKYSGPTFFGILNDLLYGQGHNERMVTALFASVDLGNGYVHVVAAGYPFMMILQNSNPAPYRNFKSSSPLGMYRKPNFYEMSFMLFPKDRLLFYTDGLLNMSRIEGKTGRSERMTAQKLWEIASQNRASSLQGMVDAIWEETLEFGRHRQMDDMLIAGIEIPELEE